MITLDFDQLFADKDSFGKVFKGVKQWRAWLVFLKAFYGAAMTEAEWEIYTACTGRRTAPEDGFSTAVLIAGRRCGKTFISSFCAALSALTYQQESAGDMPQVFVVAQDRQAAKVNLAYIQAFLECFPDSIATRNKESILLNNGVEIRTQTCSFRSSRGYHLIFLAAEEMAQWRDENSAQPDIEVMRALDPALDPGAKTIITSTPFARKGLLYSLYKDNYGKEDSDTLVWQAPTLMMRPDYSEKKIRKALEKDRIAAATEYLAVWRDDITSWISESIIDRAKGEYERLLPQPGIKYFCAVDVSGGRSDSYTMAIGHNDSGIAVIDVVEERKSPLDPAMITKELAKIAKEYEIGKCLGDRYSGSWSSKAWDNEGIFYETSAIDKSQAYIQFAAILSMGKTVIPANEVLIRQLISLERRALSSGREQVDSPAGLHDDVANSCALVACSIYKDISQRMTPEQMDSRLPTLAGKGRGVGARQRGIRESTKELNDWMSQDGYSPMGKRR